MNYQTVKRNFEKGLWTLNMVRVAVKKGIITKSEYALITGESY